MISGAGLTKDSALAFVMLERLRQRKVTVFMDSLDKWAQRGFPVTKDELEVLYHKFIAFADTKKGETDDEIITLDRGAFSRYARAVDE